MSNNQIKFSLFAMEVYFFALGLLSSLWQMIFLREVLTSWRGNELFLNYFFIIWLSLVGWGSFFSCQKLKRESLVKFVGFYYFLTGLLAIIVFLAIRFLPQFLNFTAEPPNLFHSLIALPLALLPTCLLLGIGFAWGSKFFDQYLSRSTALNVNQAYLIETFGFFIGSFAFNFWLVRLAAFKLMLLAALFALAINFLILFYGQSRRFRFTFVFLSFLAVSIIGYLMVRQSSDCEIKTANWRWPNEKLVRSDNSFFGHIAITQKEGQYNFYQQGGLAAPAQDWQISEELIHLPLLFAPLEAPLSIPVATTTDPLLLTRFVEKPQKILILGNAWNGFISEALKYPEIEIFYAELDPEFLPAIHDFLTPQQQEELKNPRVTIINQEAIIYLKQNPSQFDFILSNIPPPTTYQINRYWTKEFFILAKESLKPKGVVAFGLPYYPENLTNQNLNRFLASIFNPFEQIFKNNILVPGQKLVLLGLKDEDFKWGSEMLAEKFDSQKIETRFFSAAYAGYLLSNERQPLILEQLRKVNFSANLNRSPLAVVYQLVSQIELSQPKAAGFLNWLLRLRWFIFSFLVLAPILLVLAIKTKFQTDWPENKLKLIAVFASSLSLILEIILIFIWQIKVGYVYHQISLIVGLVMFGIFLANLKLYWWPSQDKQKSLKTFLAFMLGLTLALALFILTFKIYPLAIIKIIILGLAFSFGYLAGGIYPLANYLYLQQKKPALQEETGTIYGWELLGGGLLLVIFALFILPFLGLLALAGFLVFWALLSYSLSSKIWAVKM